LTKFRTIKNSFLGGQFSATAEGRTDLPQYASGCKLLKNMIPLLSGGAYRRPGSFHEYQLSMSTDYAPRLIPFIVAKDEAYSLLFGQVIGGSTYVKYFRPTVNNNTSTNGNVSGTHPYKVATFSNGVGVDDEIHAVQYAQSVDILYLVHPKYKPYTVVRTAIDTFAIQAFDSGYSGQSLVNLYPFLNQNVSSITLTPAALTGSNILLTASGAFFNSGHVGAIFKIDDGAGNVGAIRITTFTSSTIVHGDIIVNFGSTAARATWWESAWSDYRGWPKTACFFQSRLVFAGTIHQPDSAWFSQTDNFGVFSIKAVLQDTSPGDGATTGPTGINPFRVTLSSSQLNSILWMVPEKQLLLGTLGDEWVIDGANADFSVGNRVVVCQSKYGSDNVPAVRIGYELIFATASQDELRAYQYNYIDASYFAEPIQLLFDDYPKVDKGLSSAGRRKFRTFSWDESRKTLWCIDTAGNFFGMTRDRKLNLTSWHTHEMGGYDTTKGQVVVGVGANRTIDSAYQNCDGSVLSLIVVPNPVIGTNDIWLVVKRTINSTVKWQVERLIGKNITFDSVLENVPPGEGDPYLVDSASYDLDSGDPTIKTYTLGSYVAGKTLVGTYYSGTLGIFKISADADAAGVATLSGPLPSDYGTFTNIVVLGLPFTPIIRPLRIEAGSVIGTAQGAIKRINRCFVRFYKTMSAKIGMIGSEQTSDLESIHFHEGSTPIGQSPELFTGDKNVLMPSTYDRDGYLSIEQDDPLPFSVISIISEGQEYD
jgi:hypothetical protein